MSLLLLVGYHEQVLMRDSLIQLLEYQIPRPPRPLLVLVTKTVTWRYLGNQEWYHRSAGVKTTGKISEIKISTTTKISKKI